MKLLQCNEYIVSTADNDELVLKYQGISNHSDETASMRFQLSMG